MVVVSIQQQLCVVAKKKMAAVPGQLIRRSSKIIKNKNYKNGWKMRERKRILFEKVYTLQNMVQYQIKKCLGNWCLIMDTGRAGFV